MLDNIYILPVVIVVIIIYAFLIGYLIGKKTPHVLDNMKNNSFVFSKQKISDQPQVDAPKIDSTKFVTKIATDNLEKKYNELGDIQTTSENISESVNKLKKKKS